MLRLTAEREARAWSRSELARRARMANSTVGLIEAGRFLPYPAQLEKLALALDLPASAASELLDDVTDRATSEVAV